MRRILAHPLSRALCLYLSVLLGGFLALPAMAQAAFISTAPAADPVTLEQVRASLEDSILREKLAGMGLSADEVAARLDNLSPAERETVMAQLDQIQAGGDGLVGLVVLIILIVILVKLLNKEIVIR